jgi:EamA-like transporter family
MGEWLGVSIAVVSSCLGGTGAAVTRHLVGNADPLTLAILRWGIGFLCVLPVALLLRVRWPRRSDWFGIAALGLCFFGLFFILYNVAVSYTTAARASLALSSGGAARHPTGRRADHDQSGDRAGRGVCRHLDRDDGDGKGLKCRIISRTVTPRQDRGAPPATKDRASPGT